MILGKGMGWGGTRNSQRGAFLETALTHPAGDVGDVGAAVELDVGAVLPDLRPQLDAVTAFAKTFPFSIIECGIVKKCTINHSSIISLI